MSISRTVVWGGQRSRLLHAGRWGRSQARPEPGWSDFSGAPIIKDHTFFYGTWEVDRTAGAGQTVIANVLTPAQVAGITDPTSLAIFKANGSLHFCVDRQSPGNRRPTLRMAIRGRCASTRSCAAAKTRCSLSTARLRPRPSHRDSRSSSPIFPALVLPSPPNPAISPSAILPY